MATRVGSPELDAVLGRQFPVLDDGFLRVVDYMGTDSAIVQAARVSYGAGTKKVSDDRGLIRYLMRHRHTTPFEMCEIKLHVRVPMDAWRQWVRHRTANINEYSTRYSQAIDATSRTDPSQWRQQSGSSRQGSAGKLPEEMGRQLSAAETELHEHARRVYTQRLESGVAREQARKDLPLATYTEAYWKIDLHNLLHFLELRMDERAQLEIRQYAAVLGEQIVRRWCPLAWQAFVDYRHAALVLTRIEAELISTLTRGDKDQAMAVARTAGWLEIGKDGLRNNRERHEAEQKLTTLGITAPWVQEPPTPARR